MLRRLPGAAGAPKALAWFGAPSGSLGRPLPGYRALVVIPLMREGELIGIFSLGRPEPELRRVRGRAVGVVYQDPLSALNPVWPVGDQIAEALAVAGPLIFDIGSIPR